MKCSQQPPKKKCKKTALNDATNVVRPPANTKRSSGRKKVTAVDQKPALFGGPPSHQSGVVVPNRSLFQILATDTPQENALNMAAVSMLQSLHQSQQPLGHNNGARVKNKKSQGIQQLSCNSTLCSCHGNLTFQAVYVAFSLLPLLSNKNSNHCLI